MLARHGRHFFAGYRSAHVMTNLSLKAVVPAGLLRYHHHGRFGSMFLYWLFRLVLTGAIIPLFRNKPFCTYLPGLAEPRDFRQ